MAAFQKQLGLLVAHAVQHLDFHRPVGHVQFFRPRKSMRQAAKIVTGQRRPQPLMILHQDPAQSLVTVIRLPFAAIDGNRPAAVLGHDVFIVPVRAFDEPDPDRSASLFGPLEHPVQIVLSGFQIGLHHDAAVSVVAELVFHQHSPENLERDLAVVVLLHVDVYIGVILSSRPEDRSEPRGDSPNRPFGINRRELAVECRQLHADVDSRNATFLVRIQQQVIGPVIDLL